RRPTARARAGRNSTACAAGTGGPTPAGLGSGRIDRAGGTPGSSAAAGTRSCFLVIGIDGNRRIGGDGGSYGGVDVLELRISVGVGALAGFRATIGPTSFRVGSLLHEPAVADDQ